MAGPTKNLCAQIPVELHDRLRAEQERSGLTLSAYMTDLLAKYYEKGSEKTVEGMRTMAFQMPEEMFQRLKKHLGAGIPAHRQTAKPEAVHAGSHPTGAR